MPRLWGGAEIEEKEMRRNYSFSSATLSLTPPRSMSISARDGELISATPAWNSPFALPKFLASSGILLAPKRNMANIPMIINSVLPIIFLNRWVRQPSLKVFGKENSILLVFLVNRQKPAARMRFLNHLVDLHPNPLLSCH